MAAAFTFSPALFERTATRYLRSEGTLRHLTMGGKVHGRHPQQWPNAKLVTLGINLALRGRGRFTDNAGRSYDITPGTIFHRYPNVKHSTWFDPDSNYAELFIVFDALTAEQLLDVGLISETPVDYIGVDPLVMDEFRQLMKRMREPGSAYPARRAMVEALAFVNRLYDRARGNRGVDFWVKTIGDACFMLAHNLEEPLQAEQVAEQLGVSYAALRKQFKRLTGFAPADYRIRCKLEAAQEMLMSHSVKSTARQFGYCDAFAFSRQFKHYVGVAPTEFQRRCAETFTLVQLTRMRGGGTRVPHGAEM